MTLQFANEAKTELEEFIEKFEELSSVIDQQLGAPFTNTPKLFRVIREEKWQSLKSSFTTEKSI